MADTIRDVVIRVNLEAGNMSLGNIDTTSIRSSISQIQSELSNLFSGLKLGSVDTSSIKTAMAEIIGITQAGIQVPSVQLQQPKTVIQSSSVAQPPFSAITPDSQASVQQVISNSTVQNSAQDSVSSMSVDVKQLKDDLEDVVASANLEAIGQAGVAGMHDFEESIEATRTKLKSLQWHSGYRMTGYRQSLRDRAAAYAKNKFGGMSDIGKRQVPQKGMPPETIEFLKKMIEDRQSVSFRPEDLEPLRKKFTTEGDGYIRQNDRESAVGTHTEAAEEKRTAAIESRAQREADAAERSADREAAAEARKTQQKDAEEQKRSEQQILQEKKVASVRRQYVSDVASGVGRAAAGVATVTTATGDADSQKLLKTLALVHGSQAIYGGVSTMGGAAAGALGMSAAAAGAMAIVPAVVAAVGGAVVGYNLLAWKEQSDIGYSLQKQAIQKKVGVFHEETHNSQRRYNEEHRRAMGLRPTSIADAMTDTAISAKEHREDFAKMRTDFEGWASSSETMEQFQSRHERQSQRTEFADRQREHSTALGTLETRREHLEESERLIEKSNETIREKGQAVRDSMNAQFTEIDKNPDFGYGVDENGKRAPIHSTKQKEHMIELGTQMAGSQREEQEAIKANAEALVKIKEDELKVDQDIVKTLAEQNKSIGQYKQEAHDVVRREVAKDKAHDISVGSSDVGVMWYRKRLQEKHDRIMARREKNKTSGKDEFEGVEQYTQQEIQDAQSFGDEAGESADDQARRQGANFGVRRRGRKDTQDAKDEADRRDEETKGIEEGNEGKINKTADDLYRRKGAEIIKAMDDAMKENEVFEELMRKIEDFKFKMETYIIKARGIT